jgi:hypothetical protein
MTAKCQALYRLICTSEEAEDIGGEEESYDDEFYT